VCRSDPLGLVPPAPALRCAAWAPPGGRAACGQRRRQRRRHRRAADPAPAPRTRCPPAERPAARRASGCGRCAPAARRLVCLFCRFLRKRSCAFRNCRLPTVTIRTRSATVEAAPGAPPGPGPPPPSAPLLPQASRRPRRRSSRRRAAARQTARPPSAGEPPSAATGGSARSPLPTQVNEVLL